MKALFDVQLTRMQRAAKERRACLEANKPVIALNHEIEEVNMAIRVAYRERYLQVAAAVLKRNRQLRNKKCRWRVSCEYLRPPVRPELPLARPEPAWVKAAYRDELAVINRLKERTPEQWRRVVRRYPEPVRSRLACLVWWDYFSVRSVEHGELPWPHLDEYVSKWPVVEAPALELMAALHAVGYSAYSAWRRMCLEGDEE